MAIVRDDGLPYQQVLPPTPTELVELDLSDAVGTAERDRRVEELIIDIESGASNADVNAIQPEHHIDVSFSEGEAARPAYQTVGTDPRRPPKVLANAPHPILNRLLHLLWRIFRQFAESTEYGIIRRRLETIGNRTQD